MGRLGDSERLLRRAAETGDVATVRELGITLKRLGREDEAAACLEGAARDGDRQAALALGWLLEERGDRGGAAQWLGRAADAGDLHAATSLGVLRAEDGDAAGAEALWRRAAEGGIALAAYNLGQLLEPRDAGEAAAWYRHAVSAGGDGADAAQERLAALGDDPHADQRPRGNDRCLRGDDPIPIAPGETAVRADRRIRGRRRIAPTVALGLRRCSLASLACGLDGGRAGLVINPP